MCSHCHSNDNEKLFEIEQSNCVYEIVKCKQCNHIYTFSENSLDIETLYNSEAYEILEHKKTIFYRIQEFEYKKVIFNLKRLLKYEHRNYSLLDFGSGKGHFLYFARQLGFTVIGVETAMERAKFAQNSYNVEINNSYYSGEGKITNNTFDVITLFHVLEHLPKPIEIIKGLINYNLKEEGILVIEVPNFDSWQSSLGKKYWLHLDITRHLNHYTPNYLDNFVKELDGKIIKSNTFSFHLGIIGMLQSLMSLLGYKNSLIVDLKQNRSVKLFLYIIIFIIPAFLLESISSLFKKGGVYRVYIKK